MASPVNKTNLQAPVEQLYFIDPRFVALETRVRALEQKIQQIRTFGIGDVWARRIHLVGKASAIVLGLACAAYVLKTPIMVLSKTIFYYCKR